MDSTVTWKERKLLIERGLAISETLAVVRSMGFAGAAVN